MRVLFGITLVLILALLAASPQAMASPAMTEDQDNATAYLAITDENSTAGDVMSQANTMESIDAMVNMTTTGQKKEAALIAPELVAAGSRYNFSGENTISANTKTTTGQKQEAAPYAPDIATGHYLLTLR